MAFGRFCLLGLCCIGIFSKQTSNIGARGRIRHASRIKQVYATVVGPVWAKNRTQHNRNQLWKYSYIYIHAHTIHKTSKYYATTDMQIWQSYNFSFRGIHDRPNQFQPSPAEIIKLHGYAYYSTKTRLETILLLTYEISSCLTDGLAWVAQNCINYNYKCISTFFLLSGKTTKEEIQNVLVIRHLSNILWNLYQFPSSQTIRLYQSC